MTGASSQPANGVLVGVQQLVVEAPAPHHLPPATVETNFDHARRQCPGRPDDLRLDERRRRGTTPPPGVQRGDREAVTGAELCPDSPLDRCRSTNVRHF